LGYTPVLICIMGFLVDLQTCSMNIRLDSSDQGLLIKVQKRIEK
jgi:hypothetical protein